MVFEKVKKKDVRWLDACASAGNCVSMLFMVMIVTLISVEIFIRTVFNFSIFLSEKPLVFFLTAVIMTALVQILKEDTPARKRFPFFGLGIKTERLFRTFVTLAAIGLCSFACYQSVIMLHHTYQSSAGTGFSAGASLVIPQAVIPVGFLLFDLQLVSIFFKTLALPEGMRWRQRH